MWFVNSMDYWITGFCILMIFYLVIFYFFQWLSLLYDRIKHCLGYRIVHLKTDARCVTDAQA